MPGKNEPIDCYTQILSQHFAKHIGDRALVREMFLKAWRDLVTLWEILEPQQATSRKNRQ
jgi:hypothetical protein